MVHTSPYDAGTSAVTAMGGTDLAASSGGLTEQALKRAEISLCIDAWQRPSS